MRPHGEPGAASSPEESVGQGRAAQAATLKAREQLKPRPRPLHKLRMACGAVTADRVDIHNEATAYLKKLWRCSEVPVFREPPRQELVYGPRGTPVGC